MRGEIRGDGGAVCAVPHTDHDRNLNDLHRRALAGIHECIILHCSRRATSHAATRPHPDSRAPSGFNRPVCTNNSIVYVYEMRVWLLRLRCGMGGVGLGVGCWTRTEFK